MPRLQEKYLAELQDMAGLCERRVTPLSLDKEGMLAIPVQSFDGMNLNEFLLMHGLPSDLAEKIHTNGLDPRRAGTHFGKLFGAGTYFAANASKSDIYTKPAAAPYEEAPEYEGESKWGERCIMVVRAALGEPHRTRAPMQQATMPPERPDGRGALSSVVALTQSTGGCVEHPEFIVYSASAALPEYAIWYKHLPCCGCTHCFNLDRDVINYFVEHAAAYQTDPGCTARNVTCHFGSTRGYTYDQVAECVDAACSYGLLEVDQVDEYRKKPSWDCALKLEGWIAERDVERDGARMR